jgi:hypothetical protein
MQFVHYFVVVLLLAFSLILVSFTPTLPILEPAPTSQPSLIVVAPPYVNSNNDMQKLEFKYSFGLRTPSERRDPDVMVSNRVTCWRCYNVI